MDSPDRIRVADKRDDFPVFIHSELDDYGLTPVEFRVYGRLARRAGQKGKHSESIPKMASEFDISIRTVQRAMKVLLASNLITRHSRPGRTDEYSLNPRSGWQSRRSLRAIRQEVYGRSGDMREGGGGDTTDSGDTGDRGVVTPESGVVVTPEIDEGTPYEGTPIKEFKEPLVPFCGSAFREALADFLEHHREIRKPYKPTGLKALYRDLASWGEADATEALRNSVRNRWQGVFRPKAPMFLSEHPNAHRPGKSIV